MLKCSIFGHKKPISYEYGKLELNETDGIGRQHATVYGVCPRCEKLYRLCRVHVFKNDKIILPPEEQK